MGGLRSCCCCVSLMALTQDCRALMVSSHTACIHLSCGCYCKRWRYLPIPPSSPPPSLHPLPAVLFSIRQKSSKSENGLNSLIDFGNGLIMEMRMVREVLKHLCLNGTVWVEMLVVKKYCAPHFFIYLICHKHSFNLPVSTVLINYIYPSLTHSH